MSSENLNNGSVDLSLDKMRPSNRAIAHYGLLFMLWGWMSVLRFVLDLIEKYAYISITLRWVVEVFGYLLLIGWLAGTIYFLYRERTQKLTYFGLSLRFIWVSLLLSMSLVSIILANILHEVNFELQHPILMVFISFAIVVSGGILRNKMLVIGGIVFAMCAVVSSYLDLRDQLALEAVGWIAGFIIPGHLMYAKRNSK